VTQAVSKPATQGTSPRVIAGWKRPDAADATARDGGSLVQLDAHTYDRALACVHCGLCLPACPTYTQNGLEADSPRGRIYLMKGLADGQIAPTPAVINHLDLCLDCRACETACPSGVVYHELIETTRAQLNDLRPTTIIDKALSLIFFHIFPFRSRVRLAILPARVLQRIGLWRVLTRGALAKLLPKQLAKMQQMMPDRGALWQHRLAERFDADPTGTINGIPRATVALLDGCVGSVMFHDVNQQTVEVLQKAGCDVLVPRAQGCCGAIPHHGGRLDQAKALARHNIDTFMPIDGPRSDFIVNNAAGCGAMLKEYDHLLRDDAQYAQRAKQFVSRVRDISELLVELGPPRPEHEVNRQVTYHDACHLAHGQKLTAPPRTVLSWIKGLDVVPLPDSEMCCGAAGTYNLSNPRMARELAERKIKHVQETGARVCVAGNVGCSMQIQSEAHRLGVTLKVTHPVSLLHEAYFGCTAVAGDSEQTSHNGDGS
jgi:glycolate oxidase iron-sulfur subunit